jgi:protocatechuate 3,4-dioxygenase beta subunit
MAISRRNVMAALSVFAASTGFAKIAAALAPTPRQTEGPFYPDILPSDTDNDLVKIQGKVTEAGGQILILTGRVLSVDGAPLPGALIEIWQCDMHGNYIHTEGASSRKRDTAFQGYGRTRADANGAYSFRTIRPVSYPGRTPHIHLKAHHPNGRVLTTQMYVAGEPANARDGLYRSLTAEEQARLTVALSSNGDQFTGSFDIVI